LAKASVIFVQGDRYQTESEIRIKATFLRTDVTSLAKVTTLGPAPSQFRPEITFPSNTGTEVKSIVISDGKCVWMYRSDLKQYAVTPFRVCQIVCAKGKSSQWKAIAIGDGKPI
jgi:hypothetical protein